MVEQAEDGQPCSSHDRALLAVPLVVPTLLEAGVALVVLFDSSVLLLFRSLGFRLEPALLESHEDTGTILMSARSVRPPKLTSVRTSFIFLSSSLKSTRSSVFGLSDVSRASDAILSVSLIQRYV